MHFCKNNRHVCVKNADRGRDSPTISYYSFSLRSRIGSLHLELRSRRHASVRRKIHILYTYIILAAFTLVSEIAYLRDR